MLTWPAPALVDRRVVRFLHVVAVFFERERGGGECEGEGMMMVDSHFMNEVVYVPLYVRVNDGHHLRDMAQREHARMQQNMAQRAPFSPSPLSLSLYQLKVAEEASEASRIKTKRKCTQ